MLLFFAVAIGASHSRFMSQYMSVGLGRALLEGAIVTTLIVPFILLLFGKYKLACYSIAFMVSLLSFTILVSAMT